MNEVLFICLSFNLIRNSINQNQIRQLSQVILVTYKSQFIILIIFEVVFQKWVIRDSIIIKVFLKS